MKSKLYVVLDKDGDLIAASFARPGLPHVRLMPTNPEHTSHEVDIPHELAANPTFESLRATLAKYLPTFSNRAGKVP
jgi:hypothetical protein